MPFRFSTCLKRSQLRRIPVCGERRPERAPVPGDPRGVRGDGQGQERGGERGRLEGEGTRFLASPCRMRARRYCCCYGGCSYRCWLCVGVLVVGPLLPQRSNFLPAVNCYGVRASLLFIPCGPHRPLVFKSCGLFVFVPPCCIVHVQGAYDVSQHPGVVSKRLTEEEVMEDFISSFEGEIKDGKVGIGSAPIVGRRCGGARWFR